MHKKQLYFCKFAMNKPEEIKKMEISVKNRVGNIPTHKHFHNMCEVLDPIPAL